MLEVNYNIELGRIRIEQEFQGKKYEFDLCIHPANCEFGAVIWHGKDEDGKPRPTLMNFWDGDQHCKNLIKDCGGIMCGEKVLGAELNMYYKENYGLLKHMMSSGYKVTCYHEEPKSK